MPEPLTTAALFAGKELFKPLINDLYELIKKETGKQLNQWDTTRKISFLYRKIGSIREVKTIWQVDKPVDLLEFYCDSRVIIEGDRRLITKLSDFRTSENLLIEGIAGQGKSIFLRYLCAGELARGNYIPIFVELRRVDDRNSVKDRIYKAFESLRLKVDDDLFKILASSGKVLLLLDAFDEIPEDLKNRVTAEIEDLVLCNPNLRFIVTTRPNQSIKHSACFHVVRLDELRDREYREVILKLGDGSDFSLNLIDHIQNNAGQIESLLTTPLMVTLLVILYKSHSKLPNSLPDFYDALFLTLMLRHDGAKPGFTRHRRVVLDDMQYREAFEAICLFTKKTSQQSFNFESLNQYTREAVKQCALSVRSASLLADIVEITCLILKDGTEYRFIHKTVQEYYAAYFVKRKPGDWAKDFYSRFTGGLNHWEWRQELRFLEEIDEFRFIEHLVLPSARNLFGCKIADILNNKAEQSTSILERIMENLIFCFAPGIAQVVPIKFNSYYLDDYWKGVIFPSRIHTGKEELYLKLVTSDKQQEKLKLRYKDIIEPADYEHFVLGSEFLQDEELREQLETKNKVFCVHFFSKLERSVEKLKRAKDPSFLDGLF